MNFITKLKVQQWIQPSLQLTQFSWWHILKSNFKVSALLSMESFSEYMKENWNRFLTECYTVSRSSQISLEELLLTLNSINPSIQFTMEYSNYQIPFLDILIMKNKNSIWMDLHHKPTDTQRCLPFTYSHPNHCKQNTPFCLAWRICTIADNNAEKLKKLENLKTALSKYHYPDSLIEQGPFNTTKRLMKS